MVSSNVAAEVVLAAASAWSRSRSHDVECAVDAVDVTVARILLDLIATDV